MQQNSFRGRANTPHFSKSDSEEKKPAVVAIAANAFASRTGSAGNSASSTISSTTAAALSAFAGRRGSLTSSSVSEAPVAAGPPSGTVGGSIRDRLASLNKNSISVVPEPFLRRTSQEGNQSTSPVPVRKVAPVAPAGRTASNTEPRKQEPVAVAGPPIARESKMLREAAEQHGQTIQAPIRNINVRNEEPIATAPPASMAAISWGNIKSRTNAFSAVTAPEPELLRQQGNFGKQSSVPKAGPVVSSGQEASFFNRERSGKLSVGQQLFGAPKAVAMAATSPALAVLMVEEQAQREALAPASTYLPTHTASFSLSIVPSRFLFRSVCSLWLSFLLFSLTLFFSPNPSPVAAATPPTFVLERKICCNISFFIIIWLT